LAFIELKLRFENSTFEVLLFALPNGKKVLSEERNGLKGGIRVIGIRKNLS